MKESVTPPAGALKRAGVFAFARLGGRRMGVVRPDSDRFA
jgi:hypothetical protein